MTHISTAIDEAMRTIAANASRVIVAGGPRCGKTTFAKELATRTGVPVRHTDDLIGVYDWSASSEHVATWFDRPGSWIVEGVTAPRAIRKWLASHPKGKPADVIYWGVEPRVHITKEQAAMLKGVMTVWKEIRTEVLMRGVKVVSL